MCSDDESVCPDVTTLRNLQAVSIWGEGVEASFNFWSCLDRGLPDVSFPFNRET